MRPLQKTKKSLGQNFLIDKNIINKIVDIGKINKNKAVMEIGAGYGSLTKAIVCMDPKKIFNKKPNFAILGLNPHNFSQSEKSEEKKIIYQAIKNLTKFKIKVSGPVPTDSSFMILNKHKFDVIIGMYHDQVLTPFKALYNFNAINITLGLPYIRISPDHGVAENIIGKKIASPKSLIESIKFFNYVKNK